MTNKANTPAITDVIDCPVSDYPLALYRPGCEFAWDGRDTDVLIVNSEDEHLAAEGWQTAAEYLKLVDAPKRGNPPKANSE
jgi:hypothetical protein